MGADILTEIPDNLDWQNLTEAQIEEINSLVESEMDSIATRLLGYPFPVRMTVLQRLTALVLLHSTDGDKSKADSLADMLTARVRMNVAGAEVIHGVQQ